MKVEVVEGEATVANAAMKVTYMEFPHLDLAQES
jgi:hypothetical protein